MLLLIILSITITISILITLIVTLERYKCFYNYFYTCHNFNDWLFLIINLTIFVKIHFNYIKLHYIILNILYQ